MTQSALVTTERGIQFGSVLGFRPVELDLHRVESDQPQPVVLYVHGGGWRLGSRTKACAAYGGREPSLFGTLASSGIAVVSADYRLSAEATYPAQLDDVGRALAWIATEGPALGLDPSRGILWGDSAGGYLAAMAALTLADLSVSPFQPLSTEVRAVP